MTTNTVTGERVAKAIRNAPLPVGGGVHMSHEQALTAARAAITALPPVTPAEAASVVLRFERFHEILDIEVRRVVGSPILVAYKGAVRAALRALTSDKEEG